MVKSSPAARRLAAGFLLLALATPACGGDDKSEAGPQASSPTTSPTTSPAAGTINPSDYSAKINHPLVAFSSHSLVVLEGSERDPETGETIKIRFEQRLLDKTEVVAGVPVTVVEVKDFEDDELVERTLDYYAQHRDGTVWYFGERIDDYEGGKVVGHHGQWIAGEDGAQAGVFMPADPKMGQEFEQERAPGVAEDQSKVLAVGLGVTTPAGSFTNCIKTEDLAPIEKVVEFKYYCPGYGLVREEKEDGAADLVRYA